MPENNNNDPNGKDNARDANILTYIDIQWKDIHHSRLQEWTLLASIIGVFSALLGIKRAMDSINSNFPLFLCILGALISSIGARISWRHFKNFHDKMKVIDQLENCLTFKNDIKYEPKKIIFSAQISIFLLFGLGVSAFITMIDLKSTIHFNPFLIGGIGFAVFLLIVVGDYLIKMWRKTSVKLVINAESNIKKNIEDTNEAKKTMDELKEDINSLVSAIDYLIALSLKQKMDYARKFSVELGSENMVNDKKQIGSIQEQKDLLEKEQQITAGLDKVKSDIKKIREESNEHSKFVS